MPEQVALLRERLVARTAGRDGELVSFADLVRDLPDTGTGTGAGSGVLLVVGRFLAVLELYRRCELDLEQTDPAQPLHVRWRGAVDLHEHAP